MLFQILTVALLSSSVLAVQPEQQKRQADGGAQFSAAASQLVAQYIPQSVYAALAPSIQAAASSATVSYSDVQSLFYSALLATSVPAWFNSAIPSSYSQQFQSLEGDVSSLRAVITAAQATAVVTIPAYVAVTTTNSAGSTFTTSILTSQVITGTVTLTTQVGVIVTTTVPPPTMTTFTNSAGSIITTVIGGGVPTPTTTTFTNSAGSIITTVIGGVVPTPTTTTFTNSAGSTVISVIGVGVSGASSLGTAIASGATSVIGDITGAGGSVIGGASSALAPASTTKSGNAAARPTAALQGAIAGAAGLIGFLVAL